MIAASAKRNAQAFRALGELLDGAHPRSDMKPVMRRLEDRFLTAYSLLNADALLLERSGLEPQDALLISKIQELNRYMAGSAGKKAKVGTLALASAYLVETMSSLNVEQFHLLCLDSRGGLIRHVILEEGTEDTALFSMKDVITNAVRVSPNALILAHNHPRRTRRPSQEDLNCTVNVLRVLKALGIPLLDHIIIAGKHAVSIRGNGFIPAGEWLRQAPENRLLCGWLADWADAD